MDFIKCARKVFDTEIDTLYQTKKVLDDTLERIVRLIIECNGKIRAYCP